ncbi:MAG: methylmalonyl-CoA epimerase [Thermoplasmatales archaeon]|nr:methylmalonyl-CoA epimerase [Thermoplasmatales archaeon]
MQFDHLGVAVRDLDARTSAWAALAGAASADTEEVPTQQVRVRFVPFGPTDIELLCPTSPTSPIAKFLDGRGEGIHHVAFRVESVDSELERLKRGGQRVIDEHARPGARGRRVGFAHPSAFGGVLVEFVEGP